MLKRLLFIPLIVLVIVSVTQTQAGLYNNEEHEPGANNVFLPMMQSSSNETEFEAVPNQFVITWKEEVDEIVGLADASTQGVQVIETIDAINASVIEFPVNEIQTADAAIASLTNDPRVAAIDPNYIYRVTYTPNDAELVRQWAWGPTEAFAAWDVTRGDASITIAVIDTGIQLNHPDLDAKIVSGYDFVSNDDTADDGNGHGTHVAGSAAAETNNDIGGAGFCPDCRLMPVRVLGDRGSGSLNDVAEGIIFAADNGAQIINLSLGGGGATSLRNAIDYAWSKGAFVTCAAGNSGSDRVYYPAGYDNCVAVAATTSSDGRASFSNYGTWVDLAAPGASIYSAYVGSRYGNLSGTSMAAPHVAGLAGLLASQGLDNNQIRERLCSTSDDINGTGSLWSCGRINASRAVSGGSEPVPTATTTPSDPTATPPGSTPAPTPPGATATPQPTMPPGPTATPVPTTPPDPGAPSSIINGGFEDGTAPWTMSSNDVHATEHAASGSYSARLGGEDNSTDAITQRVQVPETARLRFKWYPESRDMRDRLYVEVKIVDTNRRGYSSSNSSDSRWYARTLNLSAFAGMTVDITFKGQTNGGVPSTFYVDDVTLTSN